MTTKELQMASTSQLPSEKNLLEILQAHIETLLALPDGEIKIPFVARERAMELTYILVRAFAAVANEVDKEFSAQRSLEIKKAYEQVMTHLYVLYAASLDAEKPWTEDQKAEFRTLAKSVRENDARYMRWSRAIFFGDEAKNQLLDQIQSGRGQQDDAEDVIALTQLMLSSNLPFPNGFFTEQELRQAELEARRFLWLLTGRDEDKSPKGSPQDLWHRAYTLWSNTYNTLMRAGRILTPDETKAAQHFPRIHSEKGSKTKSEPNETPTTPQTPSESRSSS
ncbi:MAG: hypothetical protein AAGJ35_05430 [Myxococcota bacterium]